jgi:hypothetical protein
MFVEKYLLCGSGKIFLVCPEKNILVTSPPPKQFLGEILMFSLPVRANYTVPPQTRLDPYAHDNIRIMLYILGALIGER